jgi:hypothetical protein
MYIDALNLFSDAQDVATASVISTNVLDLAESRDIGVGENMYLVITVDTAVTNTGTVTPTLLVDDDVAIGSATTIVTGTAISSSHTAGTKFVYRIPSDGAKMSDSRYMAVYYTKGGTVDTGNVTTFLAKDVDLATMFPKGYTIS